MIPPPTSADVADAAQFIAPHLPPTPLVRSEGLSMLLGCDYAVKCENLQPVGAFKVRGGVNLVGRLTQDEKRAGLISASTGNHGQSIAWAGRLFGTSVVIYAPAAGANEAKLDAIRRLGAEVRQHGKDFDEARIAAEEAAGEEGRRFVHSANEPHLIAGVGTIGAEILDVAPDVATVIVPIGGGSGAAGMCLATKARNPEIEVIGVQSASAPAAWRAWHEKRLDIVAGTSTPHEGMATRVPFAMTMEILWQQLDDFVLVEDAEIDAAIGLLAQEVRVVAEGAGAASLAAAIKLRERLARRRVCGVLSGGNLPLARYADVLRGC
ncbi:MAG: pyridoxal-phosphate dependent enzyme [bacterium]|nr:pyridoxal-phosphate dependent enzyme [bacterium]